MSSTPPTSASGIDPEVLVRVENVSKIFCRDLKKSLLYGLKDSAHDLFSWNKHDKQSTRALRPGEFAAVDQVSFDLKRGESLGLIGHNGAGKTTLLKMLNGLIKPDSGRIELQGRIGALIALGAGFNPLLTGRENIYVNASILGFTRKEVDAKFDEILDFAEIGDFIDSPVQNYSSGMQVRLGFGVASTLEPEILLLDEVLAVGDVAFQAKCFNKLAAMSERGVPFILVSHNMHQIERYCSKVVLMKHGKIEYSGPTGGGIRMFLDDMTGHAGGKNGEPDWSTPVGSGKFAFTGAEFRDDTGGLITEYRPGTPLSLVLFFEHRHGEIKNPVFDVALRVSGEKVYQSTSRSNGYSVPQLPQKGSLTVRFKSLAINSGPLSFSFCLIDSTSNEMIDWKMNLQLNVSSKPNQIGSLFVESEWMVHEHSGQPHGSD